jgi:hypothetical protein
MSGLRCKTEANQETPTSQHWATRSPPRVGVGGGAETSTRSGGDLPVAGARPKTFCNKMIKNLQILSVLLLSGIAWGQLSPSDVAKKFSRLGFLDPVVDLTGRYYSIEIVSDDPTKPDAYYLVNSIRVNERQLYELLIESFRRDPAVEARVTVSKNLTVEQMIAYTRGLVEPQVPKHFPKVAIQLEPASLESTFHFREVKFSFTPRRIEKIDELKADGFKFPYRVNGSK